MPRLFFHIVNSKERFPDEVGVALADASAAHRHALKLISQVMLYAELENGPTPERWSGWLVHVTDTNGRKVLSVLFPNTRTPEVRGVLPGLGLRHRRL